MRTFKKESSLKACLSIVTERTDTNVIHTGTGGKKTYMLTGKLEDLNVAQQLLAQVIKFLCSISIRKLKKVKIHDFQEI